MKKKQIIEKEKFGGNEKEKEEREKEKYFMVGWLGFMAYQPL